MRCSLLFFLRFANYICTLNRFPSLLHSVLRFASHFRNRSKNIAESEIRHALLSITYNATSHLCSILLLLAKKQREKKTKYLQKGVPLKQHLRSVSRFRREYLIQSFTSILLLISHPLTALTAPHCTYTHTSLPFSWFALFFCLFCGHFYCFT